MIRKSSCRKIVEHPLFNKVILSLIVLSLLPLFVSHIDSAGLGSFLFIFDLFIISIFSLETFIRIQAYNLKTFLKDPFNVLDFIIVALSLLAFTPLVYARPTFLRLLRVVRSLRTFRLIASFQHVSLVVNSVFPASGSALFFLIVSSLLFSIFGIHLLRGAFSNRCVPSDLAHHPVEILVNTTNWESWSLCRSINHVCVEGFSCIASFPNPKQGHLSFDNILSSFFNIFAFFSLEGWVDGAVLGYQALGIFGFFFVFLSAFLGSFYVLNLFTALICSKYVEVTRVFMKNPVESQSKSCCKLSKFSNEGNLLVEAEVQTENLDDEINQESWSSAKISSCRLSRIGLQGSVRSLVFSLKFEFISFTITFLMVVSLALFNTNLYHNYPFIFAIISSIFSILISLDVLLRILATGSFVKHTFKSSLLDSLDVLLLMLTLLSFFVEISDWTALVRVTRMVKVMRIFSFSKALSIPYKLLSVISASLKKLLPFGFFLIFFVLIFSALSLEVFKHSNDGSDSDFSNFGEAFLMVFLLSSGERWKDLAISASEFARSPVISGLFFISAIVVFSLIFLNIIVAIFINNFISRRKFGASCHCEVQVNESDLNSSDEDITENFNIPLPPSTRSLFLFPHNSSFRIKCTRFLNQKVYLYGSSLLIVLSCFLIANYPLSDSREDLFIMVSTAVLNVLFLLELFILLVAYSGFGPEGVFRSPATLIDSVVIILSSLHIVILILPINSSITQSFSFLLAFRALRPLRLLLRIKPGKLVLLSLRNSLSVLSYTFAIFLCFLFLFGILGVHLFHEKPPFLNYPIVQNYFGFNNVIQAMSTLFGFTTNQHFFAAFRHFTNDLWSALYFVSFLILGIWVVSSIFIALMAEEFDYSAVEIRKSFGETEEIRRYKMILSSLIEVAAVPITPGSKSTLTSQICFKITHLKFFEPFITFLIYSNTIILALYTNEMSDLQTSIFKQILNAITIIFAIEIVLKLFAYGKVFWYDPWHIYDVFVVSIGYLVIILRILRACKAIRLSQRLASVRKLFHTTEISFPVVFGVCFLYLIVFFIYAVIGIISFNSVPINVIPTGLNYYLNFQTFSKSLFTLFSIATGQNWQCLMVSSTICSFNTDETCNTAVVYVFFFSFVVISRFILFNLLCAAIIDAFFTASRDLQAIVNPHDAKDFVSNWHHFDTNHTGFLKVSHLSSFFAQLKPPLSPGKQFQLINSLLRSLEVTVYIDPSGELFVCLFEVLPQIIFRLLNVSDICSLPEYEKSVKLFAKRTENVVSQSDLKKSTLNLKEMNSVAFIVGIWKKHREKNENYYSYKVDLEGESLEMNRIVDLI
ncbi:hypothetical protein P9112_003196 [Eukaryota sp. TZLM1-RC]